MVGGNHFLFDGLPGNGDYPVPGFNGLQNITKSAIIGYAAINQISGNNHQIGIQRINPPNNFIKGFKGFIFFKMKIRKLNNGKTRHFPGKVF